MNPTSLGTVQYSRIVCIIRKQLVLKAYFICLEMLRVLK